MSSNTTTAWTLLVIAGLLEVGWAIGLKYSDGFNFARKPAASIATLAAMILSMYLLAQAARHIPIGTGYAVWTGIGALGAATLGILLFHEPATPLRILFLLFLVTGIIGLKLTSYAQPATLVPEASPIRMYIGGYGDTISVLTLDPQTGDVSEPMLAAKLKNSSFLAKHPSLPVLYAVSEVGDFEGKQGTGGVVAFVIEADGTLRRVNAQPSHGDGPCFVSVTTDGRTLFVANYGGATIASYPLDPVTGAIEPAATIDQHVGSSVHPDRQKRAYAHAIKPDPSGRFVLATDLGMDIVFVYRLDAVTSKLEKHAEVAMPPGSGPRHLAFSPDGKTCYVINELSNTIAAFEWNDGSLKLTQTLRTLPDDAQVHSTTAEVAVHSSGDWVFGSNRGHDSLATFRVDKAGRLTLVGCVSTEGKSPRHFAIAPRGELLVAANQKSNSLTIFRLDPKDGTLTTLTRKEGIKSPVCVLFDR